MPESSSAVAPVSAAVLKTDSGLKLRLYVMMFLQYFVQGCYLPVVSNYLRDGLGFTASQIAFFGSALAVGPLVAPFIIGQLVDRKFATERVLAVCHLVGGGLMLAMYRIDEILAGPDYFVPIIVLGTIYSMLYVPTMMLTNSLTFHHLRDRDREFPLIRMWGTIGFIVPAWLIEMVFLKGLTGGELNTARGIVLQVSGIAGLVMAVYSLTLPNTPPSETDRKDIAPGKVLGMLRLRHFLVLVIISLLIAMVHKFFFIWNGPYLTAVLKQGAVEGAWEQRISSIGQIFEIAVMAVLGLLLKRFGFKFTLAVGAAAYLLRNLIFAGAIVIDVPFPLVMTLVCVGQAMHGLCFGCFLAAAFIYVDRVSPPDVRGSMQNFYGVFVLGIGAFLGGLISGQVADVFTVDEGQQPVRVAWGFESEAGLEITVPSEGQTAKVYDWPGIWLSAAAIAAVAWIGLLLFFPKQEPDRFIEDAESSSAVQNE